MQKILKIIFSIFALLIIVYLLGPKPKKPHYAKELPKIPATISTIENYLAEKESKFDDIKPNNEARIIWLDTPGVKTNYVLLYLHGFSASGQEGEPIVSDFAKRYGCNAYLPRLVEHGRSHEDVFKNLTAEQLMASAQEALAVAKLLGDSIILMSCSTGGTLSLPLAADHPEIKAIITYAPNIDIADSKSAMIVKPWGLQLMRLAMGDKFREYEVNEEMAKYWTNRYRLEGLVALKNLVNSTMTEATFEKVKQPIYVGYYYKNDEEKDDIVSIPRMHEMIDQIGTPNDQKQIEAFDEAGSHVINSSICSKQLNDVRAATFEFADNILGLQPVN